MDPALEPEVVIVADLVVISDTAIPIADVKVPRARHYLAHFIWHISLVVCGTGICTVMAVAVISSA